MCLNFTTIINFKYITHVLVQIKALDHVMPKDYRYWIFCADEESRSHLSNLGHTSVKIILLSDVNDDDLDKFTEKYDKATSIYYWALKPWMLNYLIQTQKLKKVIYIDSDLVIFNRPEELLKSDYAIAIAPHYFSPQYEHYLKSGFYNGGLVAVTEKAINFIQWWKKNTYQRCEWNELIPNDQGGAVDQGYLESVPDRFDNVKILPREYNLAPWNTGNTAVDSSYLINGKEIVFYHFHSLKIDAYMIAEIVARHYHVDTVLSLYSQYKKYLEIVKKDNSIDQDPLYRLVFGQCQQNHAELYYDLWTHMIKGIDLYSTQAQTFANPSIFKVNMIYALASNYKTHGNTQKAGELFKMIIDSSMILNDSLRGGAYYHYAELLKGEDIDRRILLNYYQEVVLRIPDHSLAIKELNQLNNL